MSNSPETGALSSFFDIKDYVEATTDAAKRTRTVTIVLVVASVLVAIGYYNSVQGSWARYRIKAAFLPTSDTIKKDTLDIEHHPEVETKPGPDGKTQLEKYREYVQEATIRAYVENIRFVRAPFFGIAFDVNDLGIIGSVGLIIILLLMRYSLSREIKNLNVSFREAVHHKQLCAFYHALAMRQVFTVPHMKGEDRNRVLATAPKFICILPAGILTVGVAYDFYSTLVGNQYNFREVSPQLYFELFLLLLIWVLAVKCWERQSHINNIWDQHWSRMEGMKSSVIQLDNDLVEDFGSDNAVNNALRSLRVKALECPATD